MAGPQFFTPPKVAPSKSKKRFSLEEAILRLINHALKQTNQNVSAAARLLGVSRDYLRYRLSGRAAGETGNPHQDSGEMFAEKSGE